jgi:hypothetical protein
MVSPDGTVHTSPACDAGIERHPLVMRVLGRSRAVGAHASGGSHRSVRAHLDRLAA